MDVVAVYTLFLFYVFVNIGDKINEECSTAKDSNQSVNQQCQSSYVSNAFSMSSILTIVISQYK